MKKIAKTFNTAIEDCDEDQRIVTAGFELTNHPDDRGFAFITCKIHDESMILELESFFAPYSSF